MSEISFDFGGRVQISVPRMIPGDSKRKKRMSISLTTFLHQKNTNSQVSSIDRLPLKIPWRLLVQVMVILSFVAYLKVHRNYSNGDGLLS